MFETYIFEEHTLNSFKAEITEPQNIDLVIFLLLIKPYPKTIDFHKLPSLFDKHIIIIDLLSFLYKHLNFLPYKFLKLPI